MLVGIIRGSSLSKCHYTFLGQILTSSDYHNHLTITWSYGYLPLPGDHNLNGPSFQSTFIIPISIKRAKTHIQFSFNLRYYYLVSPILVYFSKLWSASSSYDKWVLDRNESLIAGWLLGHHEHMILHLVIFPRVSNIKRSFDS